MAAAARPYWTGFLKLSLVTIAVRLYSAITEKERVHFHQIHEPSGERVRYQTVVPGLGPVERAEIVKGYEYQKGRYVTIERPRSGIRRHSLLSSPGRQSRRSGLSRHPRGAA